MRYILLLFTCFNFSQGIKKDSLIIYYPTSIYVLSQSQKNEIATFVSGIDSTLVKQFTIKGYTDYVGSTTSNQTLSINRSNAVANHLKSLHYKNSIANGFGEIYSNHYQKNGIAKDRKTVLITEVKIPNTINYTYLNTLETLKVGDKIRLKNINFLMATDSLTQKSLPELDYLTQIMLKNTTLNITIEGHVCCGMKKEVATQKTTYENQWLSEIRAKKIYNHLLEKGIDTSRINYIGYGFLSPLKFPEETLEDEYQNRRIEIKIASNNYINQLANSKKGKRIILKNIHFEYGQYKLTPESFEEIENIYQVLFDNPKLVIAIEGHVCCGKNEEALGKITSQYNTRLSSNRALAIQKEFLKKRDS